jgi:hypothetical protein
MRAVYALAICALTTIGTPAVAQNIDWKKVDEAAGRNAAVTRTFIAMDFRAPIYR